jgi:hypothetical protein
MDGSTDVFCSGIAGTLSSRVRVQDTVLTPSSQYGTYRTAVTCIISVHQMLQISTLLHRLTLTSK